VAKKKKVNRHKKATKIPGAPLARLDRGFDFGLQMSVMAMPDFEFNQALREAGVIGCAYGFDKVEGMPQPIPSITLVGTNSAAFVNAYQNFVRWGCEEDGDVVDVTLLLRLNGSYRMWIGPEFHRFLYRTIPQADLFDAMGLGLTWVKHIDSTNKMVHDLKRYCDSGLSPVLISAATGDPTNPTSLQLKPVPEWKGVLKFGLQIIDQAEAPEDPRFAPMNERTPRAGDHLPKKPQPAPKDLCQRRIKALDTAFPVSRERVRRSSLVHDVRRLAGFGRVTETQVVQGAINLMISGELVVGDKHYSQVAGDFHKTIWDAIATRVEVADGASQPADQIPLLVARQVELDVRTALKSMKARGLHEPFPRLQEMFRKEGYVDD
jgi:hypothetical protein